MAQAYAVPTAAYPSVGQTAFAGAASTCMPTDKENVYGDEYAVGTGQPGYGEAYIGPYEHDAGHAAYGEHHKKGKLSKVKDNIKGMLGMKKKHEGQAYPGSTTGTGHHTGQSPAAGTTGTTTDQSPFL